MYLWATSFSDIGNIYTWLVVKSLPQEPLVLYQLRQNDYQNIAEPLQAIKYVKVWKLSPFQATDGKIWRTMLQSVQLTNLPPHGRGWQSAREMFVIQRVSKWSGWRGSWDRLTKGLRLSWRSQRILGADPRGWGGDNKDWASKFGSTINEGFWRIFWKTFVNNWIHGTVW